MMPTFKTVGLVGIAALSVVLYLYTAPSGSDHSNSPPPTFPHAGLSAGQPRPSALTSANPNLRQPNHQQPYNPQQTVRPHSNYGTQPSVGITAQLPNVGSVGDSDFATNPFAPNAATGTTTPKHDTFRLPPVETEAAYPPNLGTAGTSQGFPATTNGYASENSWNQNTTGTVPVQSSVPQPAQVRSLPDIDEEESTESQTLSLGPANQTLNLQADVNEVTQQDFPQQEPTGLEAVSHEPAVASRTPINDLPTPEAEQVDTPEWKPIELQTVEASAATEEFPQQPAYASVEDRKQAEFATNMAFELIQRGAPYSARSRLIEALRILSRSLDERSGNGANHTKALRRALAAYEEAEDFFPSPNRPDEEPNIGLIASGHETQVLKNVNLEDMTTTQCAREYAAFAEQEFVKALGNEAIASKALYGLGRLEWADAVSAKKVVQLRAYRSIALYQSALVVDQANFAAANELGVLLARNGSYDAAIAALQHCVRISPQPTAWQNLANLYRKLGHNDMAQRAEYEAAQIQSPAKPPFAATNNIEWVDPHQFAQMNGNSMQVARMPASMQPPQNPQPSAEKPPRRTGFRIWPFGKRTR